MIITRKSKGVEGVVYHTSGHGRKERKEPLFKIIAPSHAIVYDPESANLEARPIEVEVHRPGDNGFNKVGEGAWPLQTFSDFVEGVRFVTETAVPYIRDSEDMEAEHKISETTYVWCRFASEKVSGGFFSEEKHELIQQVLFAILGEQFGWARWEPEMLTSLVAVRDTIVAQHQQFLGDIRKRLPRSDPAIQRSR